MTKFVKFLIGAVGTVAGAQLLVDNGSALASMCGVSDRVISVTIIAIGTSLPELVTTLTAIAKKQGSLSAGNIIGAKNRSRAEFAGGLVLILMGIKILLEHLGVISF